MVKAIIKSKSAKTISKSKATKTRKRRLVKWNRAKTLNQVFDLIDHGVLLKWLDVKPLSRHIPKNKHHEIVEHMVKDICAHTQNQLHCEVTVESLLLWLAGTHKEEDFKAIANQILNAENSEEAILKLIDISLVAEISDAKHQEAAYAAAVMLICYISKSIEHLRRNGEEQYHKFEKIVPHIATYLLSVANLNDYVIRLSLLNYFGYMAERGKNKAEFEKLLNRFGYTVLDHLFTLLFKKKTEAIALQFLLDNFAYFLKTSSKSQKIIHEILKYYLLKKPERSALFLKNLGERLHEGASLEVRKAYLQHLGALLHVVAKLNHKLLTLELISSIYRFEHPFLSEISLQIQNEVFLDDSGKAFAKKLEEGNGGKGTDSINVLRSHKRGRHPSFQTTKPLETIEQVAVLGNVDMLGRVS